MAIVWLLAVFGVLLVCYGTEARVICVCLDEQCLPGNHGCLPFQVLIQEQEFSPGTDIKFGIGTYTISGNDSLNYKMVVRDTRNICLAGDPSGDTIVECDGRLRFSFINITNLTITDIQFVRCGAPWHSIAREVFQAAIPEDNPAALLLVNVHILLMSTVIITFSHGYGMLCINLFGESCIIHTNFTFNSKNRADHVGGSILLFYRDSSVYPVAEPVSILVNNCTFSHCSSTYEARAACPKMPSASGLGIVTKQSWYSINVIIKHIHFIDNYAPALAVYDHDTPASYNILIQHSYFINSLQLGSIRIILYQTAAIMIFNRFNERPLRLNSTTIATRTINIYNSVFKRPVNNK